MTEEERAAFGTLLRGLRRAHSMTLEGLAEASGVSARGIGDLERGRRAVPQRRTVAAIARGLNLTEEEQQELFDAARARRVSRAHGTTGVQPLPRGAEDFVGREDELAHLRRLARPEEDCGDRPIVATLHGPPGVGKTTLALHAVRMLKDLFPAGQLVVDLRGVDEQQPSAAESMLGVLKTLGVPDRDLAQAGPQGHPALYRQLLADRRCLLVLDNARDEAQVRPLLPGSGSTMVLVTSRRMLTGLEDVHRLQVDELNVHDSTELLTGLVGVERAAADPDALADVAALCGNLPLALRVAGNWMATRTGWSTRRLADRLAKEERRLDALAVGDLRVAAAFDLSYRQLTPCAARMFRRLAIIPGQDTGVAGAAQITGQKLYDAEDALEELVEAGLLSAVGDRYRLHDLLRLYARSCLTSEEGVEAVAAARDALFRWLLETAVVAGRWYEPDHGAPPAGWQGMVDLSDADRASEWLRTEAENWLAAFRAAAAGGDHAAVVEIAEALHWFSDLWIFWGYWPEIFRTAAQSAQSLGDPLIEATQINYHAWAIQICENQPRESLLRIDEALAAALRAGDVAQQAWAYIYRAQAFRMLGEPESAVEPSMRAAGLFRAADDLHGLLQALISGASSLKGAGRTEEALTAYRGAMAWLTEKGDQIQQNIANTIRPMIYTGIGECLGQLRQWPEALTHLRTAVDLAAAHGNTSMLGYYLTNLADVAQDADRVDEARDALIRCISLGPDADPERVAYARDRLTEMSAQA
ncbi:helix-turn-helix domain-containing protein [Streptomyces bauhiniae]|uniref:helix-turn-helix domain-containing protein n=1 Tax=Streptomyces bauhiniae TaxID=2340725 RepID=UPI0035D69BC8